MSGYSFDPPQLRRGYNLAILVDDPASWIIPWAKRLKDLASDFHDVRLVHSHEELGSGDVAFLLGCSGLVPGESLAKHRCNVVVHESDLPRGRGWSPVAWQVLEGKNEIPVCLFEAVEEADAGRVYLRDTMVLEGTELLPEIRHRQGEVTLRLCLRFLKMWPDIKGEPQSGEATWYRRRTKEDDRLPVDRTIEELFDRLRVLDNQRYPGWFEIRGRKYMLSINPLDEEDSNYAKETPGPQP
jgi:methionyl-tRNA formyltransferase